MDFKNRFGKLANSSALFGVIVLTVGGATFFRFPLAMLLAVCLVTVVIPGRDSNWVFLVSSAVLFTILNASKELEGDLIYYVTLQNYLAHRPLHVLFNGDELSMISGSYRVTELGFYAPLWLMSHVFTDGKLALAISATLGIYIPTFLAIMLIGKSEKWDDRLILLSIMFAFFAGINFVQSTHLIRQYISSAIFFYGFALFISRRRIWAGVAAFFACMIHNGTALLIPVLGVACLCFPYAEAKVRSALGISWRVFLVVVVLVATMAAIASLQGESLAADTATISLGYYVVVFSFFLVAQLAVKLQRLQLMSLHYARVAFLTLYFLSLGFYATGIKLFALRYFSYLEWVYALFLAGMLFSLIRTPIQIRFMVRLVVAMVVGAFFVRRVETGPWMYGAVDNEFLRWSYFQLGELLAR